MGSTSLANLMRDLEARKKNSEKAEVGTLKMYNPDKKFGFVRLETAKDIHFRLTTVIKSGFSEAEIVLGARVSIISWHISAIGPEVKKFLSLTAPKASDPPLPRLLSKPILVPPSLAPPLPALPTELVDEFGKKKARNIYPGGMEQLIIDELTRDKVSTRDALQDAFLKHGYAKSSLHSGLSRVHSRGWFIENGGKLHWRKGRPPE